MKNANWLVMAAAACLPLASGAQGLVTERTISVDAAMEAATAALETCRRNGYQVTVTVLNRAGRTKVVLHDDNAPPHTIENSLRKAYTSLTFRVPSGEYGKRIAATPPPHPQLFLDKVTTLEGALPIFVGKEIVGTIGVSGAPGGDKDAVCAQAGINQIAKALGN